MSHPPYTFAMTLDRKWAIVTRAGDQLGTFEGYEEAVKTMEWLKIGYNQGMIDTAKAAFNL
jgi:hypothetical protein